MATMTRMACWNLKWRIAEEGSSSKFKRQERYPGVVHECVWYIHDSRFISGKKN